MIRQAELYLTPAEVVYMLGTRMSCLITQLHFTTKCDSKKTEQKQDLTKLN